MDATKEMPKAISEAIGDLDRQREWLLAKLDIWPVLDRIMAQHTIIENVHPNPDSRQFHINCVADDVEQAAALLRDFARDGFRQVGSRHDCPENGYAFWVVQRGEHELSVFVSWTGSKCRYVQTGVQTKPVMELRCGESEVA